jgi:hypothetical protein
MHGNRRIGPKQKNIANHVEKYVGLVVVVHYYKKEAKDQENTVRLFLKQNKFY